MNKKLEHLRQRLVFRNNLNNMPLETLYICLEECKKAIEKAERSKHVKR